MAITVLNTVDAKEQFTDLINRRTVKMSYFNPPRPRNCGYHSTRDLILLQEAQDKHDLREGLML